MQQKSWWITATAALIVLSATALIVRTRAADHRDAPLQLPNPRLDINDIYVFRAPANSNNVVLVMTVHPVLTPASGTIFENAGYYEFLIDRNSDMVADMNIEVFFTGDSPQKFTVTGLSGGTITGDVTTYADAAPRVTVEGDVSIFCGPRDDPFFFDLDAFRTFTAGPYLPAAGLRSATAGAPVNFFGTLDTAAIVIELPASMLTGLANPNSGTFKIWAKSYESK